MKTMLLGAFGCYTATFSVAEVANIFHVSVDQVNIWIHDGTLPSRRMLGMIRVDHSTVWSSCIAESLADLFNVPASNEDLIDAGIRLKAYQGR